MTMSEPLPPFSGDEPTCPKCSHSEAYTEYKPEGAPGSGSLNWGAGSGRVERLERRCGRCDFTWDEAINPPPLSDEPRTRCDCAPPPGGVCVHDIPPPCDDPMHVGYATTGEHVHGPVEG